MVAFAVFLFSTVDALAKVVAPKYPANEIVFFRMLFGLLPAVIAVVHQPRVQRPDRCKLFDHVFRAGATMASTVLFFSSLTLLPLAISVTLSYSEVIFVWILGVLVLRERPSASGLMALIVGFIGVRLITLSGSASVSFLGEGLALASALFGAISIIQVKRLLHTETSGSIVLYFTAISLLFSLVTCFIWWKTPDIQSAAILASIGLIAGVAQLLLTAAFRQANASTLVPLNYLGILFASIYGVTMWGEKFTMRAVAGACLVVTAALIVQWRTKRGFS